MPDTHSPATALRSAVSTVPTGPTVPTGQRSTAGWRLVGREAELAGIHRALQDGRAGVVLAGGPGVGKTRLTREGIQQTERHDRVAQWLPTTPASASAPLGAFAHLLPGHRLPSNSLDALGRVTRSLVARAHGRATVLGIDDAHLLDDVSAAVLQRLVGSGEVFVVAALRTGEPAPRALTALWKEGLLDRLEVPALGQEHVEELITSVLGGPVSVPTSLWLHDLTHGNVLFLREVLLAGLDSGALSRVGRVWTWQGPLPVSARLADLVGSSLGELTDDETTVLELLAQGEPLEARLLEARFPAETLHAIERRGLLASEPDGNRLRLRLGNPLYGHVLRSGASPLRARTSRRELGDALAGTGARRAGDAKRIAAWRLGSGGHEPAELMVRAAAEALRDFDPALAERAARTAVTAGARVEGSLILARARHQQGRNGEALSLLARLDPAALAGAERVQVAAQVAQIRCWGLGQVEEALGALEAAGPSPLAAAVRSAVLLSAGAVPAAAQLAAGVLAHPDPGPDPAARRLAAGVGLIAAALSGRGPEPGVTATGWPIGEAEALEEPGGEPEAGAELSWVPAALVAAIGAVLRLGDDLASAADRVQARYRQRVRRGDLHAAAAWAAVLGRVLLDRGQAAPARRWLEEALLLASDQAAPVHTTLLPVCLAWLAEAEALLGQLGDAAGSLEQAESLRSPASRLFEPDLELARAWLLAAQGDLPAAIEQATAAAGTATRLDQPATAVTAWHAVVRFGDPGAAATPLSGLAAVVTGPIAAACADHAMALQAKDGAALGRVAAAFESLGAGLLAAETAAEAAGAHAAGGHRGRSLSSAAQARTLLGDCDGVRTPALIGLKAPGLTQRERQVALLAAQGLPSRAIAERLMVSVRTVDNHLQITYGKLGIAGRRALPAALDAAAG